MNFMSFCNICLVTKHLFAIKNMIGIKLHFLVRFYKRWKHWKESCKHFAQTISIKSPKLCLLTMYHAALLWDNLIIISVFDFVSFSQSYNKTKNSKRWPGGSRLQSTKMQRHSGLNPWTLLEICLWAVTGS